MQIIENNPFRILGIISNSSAKETQESETFILRYLDVGKSAELKFDITPPLKYIERTPEIVKTAKRKIHDDFDKLTHSIFWFINASMVDKIALDKLTSEKNIEKAIDSFRKGSRNFNVTKNSFSSIINFSTLEIIGYTSHKSEERIKEAIKNKYKVISNELIFKELEKIITSTSDKINHKSFIDRYIENTKDLLKELFPRKDINKLLIDIFSENESIVNDIQEKITSSLVEKIKTNIASFTSFFQIESDKTDDQIIRSRTTIVNRANKLITDTKTDLNKLKRASGADNFQYSNLVNEVYSFVNLAVILCFNKEMDSLNKKIELYNSIGGSVSYPSFQLYIDILDKSAKTISTVNCTIKSTINNNLTAIKRNHEECQKRKRLEMSNTFSNTQSYSGGSSYSSSSSNETNWLVIIIICLVCGGGCAAIVGDSSGFWVGVIVSGLVLISNLNR
tara:strand:+ start:1733 stop:3082 length:1350 start_codon:yes stop_codon:yes gene_type:complete